MALEKELGVALFDRSKRSIVLTEAGATFQKHALRLNGEYEDRATFQKHARRLNGEYEDLLDNFKHDLTFVKRLTRQSSAPSLKLDNGSHVAVMGGGPAGSFFSYFMLDMAERIGLKLQVDIYEPRDFNSAGPLGCNMCGGVIYESLVQSLAVEGINLPESVVQRGIEFNMLHLDIGNALIQTPRHEKRIATTFRGIGPHGLMEFKGHSLDGFLLGSAMAKGAHHIRARVDEVRWSTDDDTVDPKNRLVQIKGQGGAFQTYELLAVTSGVNTSVLKLFRDLDFGYQPPQTTKLLVREYYLGEEAVSRYVGPVFHAFLLDIPGLDYGAIIPKGAYVTVCLLSSHGGLDTAAMQTFLDDHAVKRTLPPDLSPENISCQCSPRINVMSPSRRGSVHRRGSRRPGSSGSRLRGSSGRAPATARSPSHVVHGS